MVGDEVGDTQGGFGPGSISWLNEGIGEAALDRENIAAITRRKEVYLYFFTFAHNKSRSDISRLF